VCCTLFLKVSGGFDVGKVEYVSCLLQQGSMWRALDDMSLDLKNISQAVGINSLLR
jgi:hypothetical protein